MATLKCVTCGGIYQDQTADGMRYYHACPPLSLAELQAAVTAGTIVLRSGETVDSAHASRVFPRPQFRDENLDRAKVAATRLPDGTRQRGITDAQLMKAPGRGTTVEPDAPRER